VSAVDDPYRDHYCHCGKWGSFGLDVSLRKGWTGTWYCGAHYPRDGERAVIIVTLSDSQIKFVDDINLEHTNRRMAAGSTPTNGGTLDYETRLCLGRNGYRAEAAARLFFGKTVAWSIRAEETGLPDFAGFIDAKGRRKSHHRLCVTPDCPTERAFLLVCGADHPRYRIVGWCWGHEAKQDRYWGDPGTGRPAWWVPEDDAIIKDPRELRRMALGA
jgi:hypothetical protein